MEVILYFYLFDEEDYEYFEVVNPLTLPRLDEPYWIYLAAIAYNPNTGVCSDFVWADYEVPALEYMLGDVNHDHALDVSDVTALITHVLGATSDVFYSAQANVDGDTEGTIDVSDVTALISRILNQR